MVRKVLTGITYCLSGYSSQEYYDNVKVINAGGAENSSNVTKQVTHLISTKEDVENESSKVKRAKELALPIVSLDFALKSIQNNVREKERDHLLWDFKGQKQEDATPKRKAEDTDEPKSSKKAKTKKTSSKSSGINFKALPDDVLPSHEFETYWADKFSQRKAKNKIFGNKEIIARLDVPTGIDEKSYLDFFEVSSDTAKEVQLTENIYAALTQIDMTTLQLKPEDDDYGSWKRYGSVEITFVNKKNPNLIVRTYATESFNVVENIFHFDSRSAIEILFADLEKSPKQWNSWILPFKADYVDAKIREKIGGYPIFYQHIWNYDETNYWGRQAFPAEAEALRQAADFLRLDEEAKISKLPNKEKEEEEEEEHATSTQQDSTNEKTDAEKSGSDATNTETPAATEQAKPSEAKSTAAVKSSEPKLHEITLPLLYAKACAMLVQPYLKKNKKSRYTDDTSSSKFCNFGYTTDTDRIFPFKTAGKKKP